MGRSASKARGRLDFFHNWPSCFGTLARRSRRMKSRNLETKMDVPRPMGHEAARCASRTMLRVQQAVGKETSHIFDATQSLREVPVGTLRRTRLLPQTPDEALRGALENG